MQHYKTLLKTQKINLQSTGKHEAYHLSSFQIYFERVRRHLILIPPLHIIVLVYHCYQSLPLVYGMYAHCNVFFLHFHVMYTHFVLQVQTLNSINAIGAGSL